MPESAFKCIESWKKYFPDYEIKEWNESNFDINIIPYTSEAYKAKKYAFVSDYARFYVLYKYGGLYFDTDVEVIRNMDDIVSKGPFMGCENDGTIIKQMTVAAGLGLGAEANMDVYRRILEKYQQSVFMTSKGAANQITVVGIVTSLLFENGLKNIKGVQECLGLTIYPKEYFCPLDYTTGELNITGNTRTIHHYAASWLPWYDVFEGKFWQFLGLRRHYVLRKLFIKLGMA